MLDLKRLAVFREVAAARSFSVAAERLDYTQSTVSGQVAALERELGTTLLDRTARPVRPTPAGELVLRRAEGLLAGAREVEAELAALAAGRSGLLRIAGFSTAWATFMPPALSAFGREWPGVELELAPLEPEPALAALAAGRIDLAVFYEFPERAHEVGERVERVHLLDDPYALALPREHPLARRRRLRLADLAEERWLSPPPEAPYAEELRELLRAEGIAAPRFRETDHIAMAQPLIAAGLAVGVLPALNVVRQHPGIVVRPLPAAPLARSVFLARIGGHESAAAGRMVAALRAAAREV